MQFVSHCQGRLGRPCVSGKGGGPAQLQPGQQFCGTCMRRKIVQRSDKHPITIVLIVVAVIVVIIVFSNGSPRCSVLPPGSDETESGASSQIGAIASVAQDSPLAP